MMATKRKFSDEDTCTLYGYIQSVSDVKKSRTSSTTYFDGVMQTGKDSSMRFVSFTPGKIQAFQTACATKSPVKMTNPKLTPIKGKTEVTIERGTQLTVVQKKLDFSMKQQSAEVATEKQINEVTEPSMLCTLTVKVIHLGNSEQRTTMYGTTSLQTATLADGTGNIKLPLWGHYSSKVQVGKSYKVINLCSRYFNKILQVSTTRETQFLETDDLQGVDETIPDVTVTTITGKVQQVQICSTTKCLKCAKALDDVGTRVPGTPKSTTIRCPNCKCKQRLADVKNYRKATMNLVDTNNCPHNIVVFSDVLSSFCVAKNITDKDDDSLEDYFLEDNPITINCQENSDIVTKLL